MTTDTSIVALSRAEFDATCRQYRLTPEPVYAEGFIEATFRRVITYRAPLNDEENIDD